MGKLSPSFGDVVENGYASEDNPTRRGFFVRAFKRTGRMNPGLTWEITDKAGKFWEIQPAIIGERLTVIPAARSEAQPSGYDGGKSLGERWSALAPAHRFGRFLTEDAVPLIAPGTLLRFYSSDPWFEPGPDLPRCGEIVAFTGKVSNAFPKVGPHLEVAALDGKVWPGGGWVFRLFQFVSDPPALTFTASLSDASPSSGDE